MKAITKSTIKQWVKALRSGDYKQGVGGLCSVDASGAHYCCLGVLAEVLGGEDIWWYSGDETLSYTDELGVEHAGYLSNAQEADLRCFNLKMTALMGKNDDGESFDEIADHIESKIK